ncbi:MAG: class I SAM-dependent methyltransferase [Actinomycetota bacterium]
MAVDTAVSCPLCGGGASLRYSGCEDLEYFMEASFDLYRCDDCHLVFMHPLPTRAELPGLYPSTYHNFDPPKNPISRFLLNRYYEHQCAIARRHLPDDGSLLEIGCASGDILERMQRRGYHDVQGIELSLEACEHAWQRGLKVFHGTLDEFETDQRFDMIFMSHVIEHVLDPVATVAKITSLLKPGGVLYIETPNVGSLDARLWRRTWGLIHYPRHLYLFDRSTVRRLLERGGLAVEDVSSQVNSCGWALSLQSALRRRRLDRSRKPRSAYYPVLLLLFLPMNVLDFCFGGTAFMSAIARKPE